MAEASCDWALKPSRAGTAAKEGTAGKLLNMAPISLSGSCQLPLTRPCLSPHTAARSSLCISHIGNVAL